MSVGGQSAPRYSGIAAVLRRRIETGELAPGDRVPSTREITRRWGVAMATATKALTELRREGLVRAVPGVGTVVAPRDRPARPARPRPRPTGADRPGRPPTRRRSRSDGSSPPLSRSPTRRGWQRSRCAGWRPSSGRPRCRSTGTWPTRTTC
ncbi:winged helix-turn-helix domain-containing protein [Streptomyces sp. S399]|uniref:winged helix-turn-helix domain-containing protein n=1 Tax=Streptomyces sp. S399 TaxID=3096009 RepID=UPI002A82CB91|nr:winged helix-turn-helix domain-containing protein [Streptomyces sp. S399]WPR52497.1 winged helix-turn-helix domain-containing protein [Streptomyces sp. S399]